MVRLAVDFIFAIFTHGLRTRQRIWKLHLSVKLGTLFKYEFVFLSGGGEREGELGAAEHANHANIAKLFYTPKITSPLISSQ